MQHISHIRKETVRHVFADSIPNSKFEAQSTRASAGNSHLQTKYHQLIKSNYYFYNKTHQLASCLYVMGHIQLNTITILPYCETQFA